MKTVRAICFILLWMTLGWFVMLAGILIHSIRRYRIGDVIMIRPEFDNLPRELARVGVIIDVETLGITIADTRYTAYCGGDICSVMHAQALRLHSMEVNCVYATLRLFNLLD